MKHAMKHIDMSHYHYRGFELVRVWGWGIWRATQLDRAECQFEAPTRYELVNRVDRHHAELQAKHA